ncbi:MAG TPA: hypothetical protein VIN69_02115 [Candidatus Limnocylindria bacterium]
MRTTDGGRIGPRALMTRRTWLAVEDDAPWMPLLHGSRDLSVIRDRHVRISRLVEQPTYHLAHRGLILDKQDRLWAALVTDPDICDLSRMCDPGFWKHDGSVTTSVGTERAGEGKTSVEGLARGVS